MICVYLIIKQSEIIKNSGDNDDDDDTEELQVLTGQLMLLMSPSEEKEVSQYVQVERKSSQIIKGELF